MAQLPVYDQNRVQIDQAPSAVTPRVQAPEVQYVGMKAAADYQTTIGNALDRVSQTLFGYSKKFAEEAGYQFALENPLTNEQLDAMSKGDPTKVIGVGSPFNIKDQAVRKARALEVSSYAEIMARNEALKMIQDAELGKPVNSRDVESRLVAITDGYSKSLSRIDPESSFKFRASLSTMGKTVLGEISKIETKKAQQTRTVALDLDYNNTLLEIEKFLSNDIPLDPATGMPHDVNKMLGAVQQRFLNGAILIGGPDVAQGFINRMTKDVAQAKQNAVTNYVTSDEFFKDPKAFERMRLGDFGKMTPVVMTMPIDERSKVVASFMTFQTSQHTLTQNKRKEEKDANMDVALDLLPKMLNAKSDNERLAVRNQIAGLKVLSFEQQKTLLEGGMGNPRAIFNIEDKIDSGVITNSTQLIEEATTLGIGGEKLNDLRRRMSSKVDKSVSTGLRNLAGVPEGPVDSKSLEFQRYLKVQSRFEEMRNEAVTVGKPFDQMGALRKLQVEKQEKMNSDAAKSAQSQLEMYEKNAGGKITSESLPALEEKVRSGKSKVKPRELEQIKKLVRKAEGLDD